MFSRSFGFRSFTNITSFKTSVNLVIFFYFYSTNLYYILFFNRWLWSAHTDFFIHNIIPCFSLPANITQIEDPSNTELVQVWYCHKQNKVHKFLKHAADVKKDSESSIGVTEKTVTGLLTSRTWWMIGLLTVLFFFFKGSHYYK